MRQPRVVHDFYGQAFEQRGNLRGIGLETRPWFLFTASEFDGGAAMGDDKRHRPLRAVDGGAAIGDDKMQQPLRAADGGAVVGGDEMYQPLRAGDCGSAMVATKYINRCGRLMVEWP